MKNTNPHPEVKAQVVFMDPMMARQLIESNTENQRAVAKSNLSKIQDCIVNGWFVLNGESIIVSNTGRLLNGQHRVLAVLNTGTGIWTVLVTGVPDEYFHTIDSGKARTFANALQIDGATDSANVATTIMRLAEFFDDPLSLGTCKPRSNAELFEVRRAYPRLEDSINAVRGPKMPISRSRIAWLHCLVADRYPEKTEGFLRGLAEGVYDRSYCEQTVNPVYLLRERFSSNREAIAKLGLRYALALIVQAWNAHLESRPLRILRWSDGQPFPLLKGL